MFRRAETARRARPAVQCRIGGAQTAVPKWLSPVVMLLVACNFLSRLISSQNSENYLQLVSKQRPKLHRLDGH